MIPSNAQNLFFAGCWEEGDSSHVAHSRHCSVHWCAQERGAQRRRGPGQPRLGSAQQAGGTVYVSSAAPHYSLLTLNSFSAPPTLHIFLVIRQQSTLLCVAWAHCFSSLRDFYAFFFSNRKVIAVSAFQNKYGAQFSLHLLESTRGILTEGLECLEFTYTFLMWTLLPLTVYEGGTRLALSFCQQNMLYAGMEEILKNHLDHSKPPLTNEIIHSFFKGFQRRKFLNIFPVQNFLTPNPNLSSCNISLFFSCRRPTEIRTIWLWPFHI